MRVISGIARRRTLVAPSGSQTRPTTDRVKETLFNILQGELQDIRFLDLFSGSGGIGIEALSRGAGFCAFVEKDREALRCIRANLEHTRFVEKSKVFPMDVMRALYQMDGREEAFDLVFLDPPYGKGMEEEVISFLVSSSLVKENTLIVLETSLEQGRAGGEREDVQLERRKEYKTNCHLFYRVKKE